MRGHTRNQLTQSAPRGGETTHQHLVQQRKRLLRIRASVLHQIKRLAEEACEDTPGYSVHMADAATDSFDRDLALGLASFEQDLLYEVDAALKRLDDGAYGICELTGKPIPWNRLRAIPWARFSVAAETNLEGNAHPHIGTLRTVRPDTESFDALSGEADWEASERPHHNGWPMDDNPREAKPVVSL
jgi:RNA polymerase-binding transcription factor DksA